MNNAGVFPSQPFLDVDDATLDKVLDLNLRGAFVFSQVAAQQMVDAGGGGSIIQVASIDALHPSGNLTAYDASKGGLLMLTKSMAKDLASHGIRVNAICPGGVSTPGVTAMVDGMAKGLGLNAAQMQESMAKGVPLGRMGDADDIARFGERYWRGRGEDGDAGHAGLGLALASAMAEPLGLKLGFALEAGAVVARLGPLAAL